MAIIELRLGVHFVRTFLISGVLMIVARFVVLAIVFSSIFASSQTTDAATKTCTITGRIVRASDGQPLKGAQIRLMPASAQSLHGSSALSDAEGKFTLNAIPPGQYHLSAMKNGYVSQSFKAKSAYQEGAILTLAPGQEITDVIFRLVSASVVVGRVVNEDDEPVQGVEVQALLKGNVEDPQGILAHAKSALVPVKMAVTNDLGEYRLYGLPPHTYYLSATDSGMPELTDAVVQGGGIAFSGTSNDMASKYPPLYYPGVLQIDQATPLVLHPGEEARVDFKLQAQRLARISGRVLGTDSQPAAGVMVSLRPRELSALFASAPLASSSGPDGHFEIKNVPAGAYLILASGPQQELGSAQQPLDVAAANVQGLELALKKPLSLKGKVVAPIPLPFKAENISIFLQSADSPFGFGGGQLKSDGTFEIDGLQEGSYSIRTNGLPDGWYLAGARLGSSNALDDGLTVSRPMDAALQLSFSSATAEVEGSVLDGSNAAEGAEVRLQPAKDNPFRSDLNQRTTTDQNGHFQFKNVPPGRYELFVSSSEDDSDEDNSNPSPAATVNLEKGSHQTVQLSLATKANN